MTHSVGSKEDYKQQSHWDVDKSSSNENGKDGFKLMVKTERQEWKINQAGLKVHATVCNKKQIYSLTVVCNGARHRLHPKDLFFVTHSNRVWSRDYTSICRRQRLLWGFSAL